MHYTWNEQKRRSNLRKHGVDFVGCEAIFDGHTFTMEDARFRYYERRFVTLGLLDRHVVLVAHTEWEDLIEIISIRKAKRHEEILYFQNAPFPQIPH